MTACEYVRQHYGVPACIGRRVTVYGNPGIIAEDRGHYIGVNFDDDKPGHIRPCHPTDGVEYFGMGKVRRMTPAQQRYLEYLDRADAFQCGFGEYLRTKSRCEHARKECPF